MKSLNFKNWKIFNKIISLVAFVILIFVFLLFVIFLPNLREKIVEEKEQSLKNSLDVAYSVAEEFYKKSNSGELSKTEAMDKAKSMLRSVRYDKDQYFFIFDPDLICILHPIQPDLEGKSVSDKKDPNGVYLFREMRDVALKDGDGFVSYMWPKPGVDKPVPKITYAKMHKDFNWIIGTGIYVDDIDKLLGSMRNTFIMIILIAAGFSILLGVLIARFISNNVKIIEQAAQKIAGGDINVNVDLQINDEIGSLAVSFQKMVENIRNSMDEIRHKTLEAEKATHKAHEAEDLANKQKEYLGNCAKKMLAKMERFADGDLTVNLEIENKEDDIGKLFSGFNQSVWNLHELISSILEVSVLAASASAEISSTTEQLAAGAQEQSSQTADVAAAVEEMTKTILATASNASNVSNSSKDVSEQARLGVVKVDQNKKGIERIINSAGRTGQIIASLAGKTDQIGEIARVIDDIANQTNLLALNAAIEAARAGEQGRGFAVVADEVRKLAERTTKATKEIAETIAAIQREAKEADSSMGEAKHDVEDGKKLTEEVEVALIAILDNMKNLSLEIEQVAAASEEQSTTAEQISKNIEMINSVTNETSKGITQIAAASEDLQKITEKLNNQVGSFIVDNSNKKSNFLAGNKNSRHLSLRE